MQVAEVKQLEDQLWEAVKVNLEEWLVVVEVT